MMADAEIAVVWDVHLGGFPVCLIGIKSQPQRRLGMAPADGPKIWTAGTLFPLSSKKIARAINAASGNRPVVILANLSGFDGSPESMRHLQLEYGAEIGRAVVNFVGPFVFCVISRYHGGAYVVFSRTLNDNMEVAAIEGSYASVIGGTSAATVVLKSEVLARTHADPKIKELERQIAEARGDGIKKLQFDYKMIFETIQMEKQAEVAKEFDEVHDIQRAKQVQSLDRIISPQHLRPYLIDAVERGMQKFKP
jgi:acetyl-CoA carboxylase carboxyltransferase component